jgi:hypothetical protein
MKKYIITLTLAALPFLYMTLAPNEAFAQTDKGGKGKNITVPKGKTYVLLGKNDKVIRTYKGGTVVHMADRNCVQVPCPSIMKGGTTCWKCDLE